MPIPFYPGSTEYPTINPPSKTTPGLNVLNYRLVVGYQDAPQAIVNSNKRGSPITRFLVNQPFTQSELDNLNQPFTNACGCGQGTQSLSIYQQHAINGALPFLKTSLTPLIHPFTVA